jgi:hypothetical protein
VTVAAYRHIYQIHNSFFPRADEVIYLHPTCFEILMHDLRSKGYKIGKYLHASLTKFSSIPKNSMTNTAIKFDMNALKACELSGFDTQLLSQESSV